MAPFSEVSEDDGGPQSTRRHPLNGSVDGNVHDEDDDDDDDVFSHDEDHVPLASHAKSRVIDRSNLHVPVTAGPS